MMTNTNKSRTGRKALATLIREAGNEIGMSVEIVIDPTGQGRLMYSIAGSKALTPGEAARVLSVEW
jgi:hypothetical protein